MAAYVLRRLEFMPQFYWRARTQEATQGTVHQTCTIYVQLLLEAGNFTVHDQRSISIAILFLVFHPKKGAGTTPLKLDLRQIFLVLLICCAVQASDTSKTENTQSSSPSSLEVV